ncbi:hypothetical protein [Nocardia sp. NPDC057440]|uniref:hypothetical protein n=1 Tax=Nocardia sp. NPDC057440 TaxID=3346134 RepID=UPI00366ADD07
MFYRDLREHVREHEMPLKMRETDDDDTWAWTGTDDAVEKEAERAQWLANRTWGRAIQIKQDHLRQQGVTGRAHAQSMWDWKDKLERAARDYGDPLPFLPEIAGREPRMSEVYRGDGQPREVIFTEGFQAWRDAPDADRALMDPRPGYDGRIYTAKELEVAALYPLDDPGRHVYVIEDARNYTDIEDARKYNPHGPRYEAGEAGEVVFPNVPPDKIKGELRDPHDPSAGLIANPNFKPYEPPPIRPPREDGD